MEKRIIFSSEQIVLYKVFGSISYLFKDISMIGVSSNRTLRQTVQDKHDIILNFLGSADQGRKWLWDEVRSDLLNPVIALGGEKPYEFLENNQVFEKCKRNHRYVGPPWRLMDILSAVYELVPLHDDTTLELIVKAYGGVYIEDRIYFLLDHDLRRENVGKNMTTLREALGFAHQLGDKPMEERLNRAIEIRPGGRSSEFNELTAEIKDSLKSQVKMRI